MKGIVFSIVFFLVALLNIANAGFVKKEACKFCEGFVNKAQELVEAKKSQAELLKLTADLCHVLGPHWDVDKSVCDGLIREFNPAVFEILQLRYLDANWVCQQAKLCPAEGEFSSENVLDSIPEAPRAPEKKKKSRDTGMFLQLTDIHLDMLYAVGSKIDCGEPLCCRAAGGEGTARRYGEYDCDTPLPTLNMFGQHIFNTSGAELDFIVFTGDSPPHDVWEQSVAENTEHLRVVAEAFQEAFPGIPLIPALGNHDTYPIGLFRGPEYDQWLYDSVVESWRPWLTPEMEKQFHYAGYFSMHMYPGLRVLSLNPNYYLTENLWIYANDPGYDLGNQLAWMETEFAEARAAKEKVLVLTHIPIGDASAAVPYATKLKDLFLKNADLITGIISGHTHNDHFEVIRDAENAPKATVWIAPSLCPFSDINPSYRLYEFDRETFEIVDIHQYHWDIERSYETGTFEFTYEYSMLDAYNMKSLSPADVWEFVGRMWKDDELFQEWYENYWAGSHRRLDCDSKCVKDMLCEAASAVRNEYKECMGKDFDEEEEIKRSWRDFLH